MKTPSRQAFLLATFLYALIAGGLYWLLAPHSHTSPALKPVPVTLAMFQPQPAPIPKSTPAPKAPPVEKVKPTQTPHTPPTPPTPPKKKPITSNPNPVKPKPVKPKATPKPKVKPTPKPKPHPKPKPKPVPKPKPEPKRVHTPKPQPTPQKVKPTPPAVTQPVKPSPTLPKTPKTQPTPPSTSTPARSAPQAHTPAPSASQIKAIEQRYLYELSQTLAHYAQNNYPTRARRRHQQGQVLLSFTLQPNGQITQITLKQSSGHRLLDQAALNILTEQMQQRFKPFPKELPKTPKKIVVPIQYSLQ